MKPRDIQYATRDGASIAYEVTGSGPIDLVYMPSWYSNLEWNRQYPPYAAFLDDLERFARLIVIDRRGLGCSDGIEPSLEDFVEDLLSVLDAAGSRRAVLFGVAETGAIALMAAALHPQRVAKLVLMNTAATYSATEETPWSATEADWDLEFRMQRTYGSRSWAVNWARGHAPEMVEDMAALDWLTTMSRLTAGPGQTIAETRMFRKLDLRPVLPAIQTPTLVLQRPNPEDSFRTLEETRDLAARLQDARLESLAGEGVQPWAGDHAAVSAAIERFLSTRAPEVTTHRRLVTIAFTDIVGSTDAAARLGDAAWTERLAAHHAVVRAEIARHRGREVNTTGDGFQAAFDGPAAAIRCAMAIVDAVRPLGLEVRAGVHTGEVEVVGDKIEGIAVHVGARVAALAGASEVLVSRTVRDLTAGSGLAFEDRGEHELKGVPDRWRLYRVVAG